MSIRKFHPENDGSAPLERVWNHPLPDSTNQLIEDYDAIVGDRNRFLWKWAHHLFPKFTLSCVPDDEVTTLQDAKLRGLMYVSILDDIVEKHNDRATFEEAAKIPFEHRHVNPDRDGVDREILQFATDIWNQFAPTVQQGCRAEEFTEIIAFDLKQVLNAIEYSYLMNQNLEFATLSQLKTYDSHNMMLFGFADIDLVHSSAFDIADLAPLRHIIEHAQRMVRIGNWITTWEREFHEGDFTSGIAAYALNQNIVSTADLYAIRDSTSTTDIDTIVDTIHAHNVEDIFLQQWEDELAAARRREADVDSVNIASYLDGIETVMDYHLASRGLK